MNTEISIKIAKELSLIKWNAIYDEVKPEFPEEYKDVLELNYNCGFCLRHNYNDKFENEDKCANCEFGKLAGKCCDKDSLYDKWLDFSIDNSEMGDYLASRIISIIESIEE